MGHENNELAAQFLKVAAQEYGNEPLPTRTGLDIWRRALGSDQAQVMVVVGRPDRVEKFLHNVYHQKRRPAYRYASKVDEVYSLILPAVNCRAILFMAMGRSLKSGI